MDGFNPPPSPPLDSSNDTAVLAGDADDTEDATLLVSGGEALSKTLTSASEQRKLQQLISGD